MDLSLNKHLQCIEFEIYLPNVYPQFTKQDYKIKL